jgi:hypothetical protein
VGPEIMLALQAMRAAYSGIQYCCEALREGSVEIQRVKKTVEGGVADAKKIYAEVTGIWGWLKSLLGAPSKPNRSAQSEPTTPAAAAEPVAKKKSKAKDEYIEHVPTEDEVVQQFIGHVGDWFDKYAFLKSYTDKRYAEVFGKDVIDQKEVLELTQLQVEVDAAYPALMSLMTSNAPWQLGPIWSQFKDMQDKVKAGQAARQLKEKRERARREAAQAKARDERIDKNVVVFFTVLLISYFWLLIGIVANV